MDLKIDKIQDQSVSTTYLTVCLFSHQQLAFSKLCLLAIITKISNQIAWPMTHTGITKFWDILGGGVVRWDCNLGPFSSHSSCSETQLDTSFFFTLSYLFIGEMNTQYITADMTEWLDRRFKLLRLGVQFLGNSKAGVGDSH